MVIQLISKHFSIAKNKQKSEIPVVIWQLVVIRLDPLEKFRCLVLVNFETLENSQLVQHVHGQVMKRLVICELAKLENIKGHWVG